MFSDFIQRLSKELLPDEAVSLAQGQTSFSLELNDVPITISDAAPGIIIDSNLGKLPSELPDRFMAKMLQGNFLGQLTRRAVLGLNEQGDEIVLTLNLPIVRNYREFRDQIEDFVNVIVFWQEELRRHPND